MPEPPAQSSETVSFGTESSGTGSSETGSSGTGSSGTSSDTAYQWVVGEEEAGQRADRWLAQRLDKPRNQVQRWITEGRLTQNQRSLKASTVLIQGARIYFDPPAAPVDPGVVAEPGELCRLYEDDALLVLNKRPGMAVHPGAGRPTGTLANFLLHHYPQIVGVGGPGRPGIVHRLDLDTTGALIIALDEAAYLSLSQAFAERRIQKTYLAVAYGYPKEEAGTIDLPLARHPQDRKRMAVRQGGRPALTHYRVLETAEGLSCLELDLETGRTHQIRVHLKAIGHPLVGDPVYGEARWRGLAKRLHRPLKAFARPALHAWRLALDHPSDPDVRLEVEAPIPADLETLWQNATSRSWPEA